MYNLLLAHGAGIWNMNIWYALPAVIAISLVYAATRHEQMRPILAHAIRVGLWLVGFMFVVFVVEQFLGWFT
jgi:hypothetical protein